MAPFIENGVYVIRNVESNMAVCLQDGAPMNPVVGCKYNPGHGCQQWHIQNQGDDGNQITIQSRCARAGFVYASQFQGAPLFGNPTPTVWTVVKVDHGYYIQSPDADFVWQFDAEGVPIVLVHHTGQDNTRWVFLRVY